MEATVKRPIVKGEMRIFGFDESVSVDDVRHDVSKAGDSLAKKVDVGPIRRMSNELFTVWVCCPPSSCNTYFA